MSTIDYDKFGHCVVCHKNMLIEQVVGGVVEKRLSPEYKETEFLLNDGSRMRVAVCKKCKASDINKEDVMKCVKKGWDKDSEDLVNDKSKPNWTSEKKDSYMSKMNRLEIVTKSEGIEERYLQKALDKFNKKKVK